MQVWIGLQRDDAYVHEWTGEVAEERDMGKAIGNAIGNAITAYMKSSGKPIWGTTILVDKARPEQIRARWPAASSHRAVPGGGQSVALIGDHRIRVPCG
jgi:hypothetical protein